MNSLQNKNILIGISGGIAAYKILYLIRFLVKTGANLKVVMTPSAKEFVTPLSVSVLSKNEVYTEFSSENSWNSHIDLALWADAILIAPATANTMAKMCHGICDNLLLGVYLSAKCPVFFAPAMDLDMYRHASTQKNIEILKSFNHIEIPAESGELASGLVGEGRMAEPETIFQVLEDFFVPKILQNKKILINAGPTYELIDPVRFIGNFSTGKMGIALANAAAKLGAEVTLVLGTSSEKEIHKNVKVERVVSTEQMYERTHKYFKTSDIAILSAAVADYTPKYKENQKIKKKEDEFYLELVKTKDILASLGKIKENQKLIGFALETQNEVQNAITKIRNKNLDAIVLNSLNDEGAGFGTETNKILLITQQEEVFYFDLKTKKELAFDILDFIIKHCK